MPALPTTGEIRFSAIGTEFSDPYSLTDSTKTIRLSHYYKNIQDITTNHINTFPDSFDEFRLISFRGKERFNEELAPTDAQSTVSDWIGGNEENKSNVEWLHGVKIDVNRTTKEHATERLGPIDELNRGKVSARDDRRSEKIHARITDKLTITGVIRVAGWENDSRRISVYLKKPGYIQWRHLESSNWQQGAQTHIVEIDNLQNYGVGVYAIIVGGYYSNISSWGSVKKYTLEIW